MSKNFTTYVVTGLKTTKAEMEAKWPVAFERILSEDPAAKGIAAVQSEANKAIVIGLVHAEQGPLSEISKPQKLQLVSVNHVADLLRGMGINPGIAKVATYVYGTWG